MDKNLIKNDFNLSNNLNEATISLFHNLNIELKQSWQRELSSYFKNLIAEGRNNQAIITFKTYVKEIYISGFIGDINSNLSDIDTIISEARALKERWNRIGVISIECQGTPNRSDLVLLSRTLNKLFEYNPVVTVFRYQVKEQAKIAITIAERSDYIRPNLRGEKIGKVFILKDVDIENPHSGHIQILEQIENKASHATNFTELYEGLIEVFSTKLLIKEFYTDLSQWFYWAMSCSSFPNDIDNPDDDTKFNKENVIRLITRIIFVWFLRQKDLVPTHLFNKDYIGTILKNFDPISQDQCSYYNAIIQNLFFATLNTKIENRSNTNYKFKNTFLEPPKTINHFQMIPYLNGGLFDVLDDISDEGKTYYWDGYSEEESLSAKVPNYLFFKNDNKTINLSSSCPGWDNIKVKGLITILSSYNFTIEENTPLEQEIALDPELLGRVFENLLSEYNEETHESARNATGSFYTPREIVDLMVEQSIKNYLTCGEQSIDDNTVDNIIDESNIIFADNLDRDNIKSKLLNVKIFDPACGSGAFPVGCLLKISSILHRLYPESNKYDLKKQIIKNCLFGVDIQPIAVMITKLRFFLSLLCDQNDVDKNDWKNNYHVETLPNLETRFVSADTLIDLSADDLFAHSLYPIIDELSEIREAYFSENDPNKKKVIKEKDQLIVSNKLIPQINEGIGAYNNLLTGWSPYDKNKTARFFNPLYSFAIKTKFDIVIGNPPYIQLQSNQGALGNRYQSCHFESFARTGDIYALFYERGWQLLKEGGHLCYITSNKWMRAGYGESLRSFIASKADPKFLIDFGGIRVFESATVDTNILIFQKCHNQGKTKCILANSQNINGLKNLSDFVKQEENITKCSFTSSDSWVILSPIELSIKRKIEAVGIPLRDWDIEINYGIKTGCNEAFIINAEKREEILNNCKTEEEKNKTADLIRPILRGRDIKRYSYVDNGLYLINTHNGVRGRIPRIKIEDYPAIKAHLSQYWDKIATRADKGDTPYNLRNCAYLEDFNKPKIIYPNMTKYMPFVYDDKKFLTNQKCFIITGKNVAYLTAFFNSSLFKYCFRDSFPELQGGTRELSKIFFDKIPVCEISDDQNLQFQNVVKDIQNGYTKQKAQRIDSMLFDLYNLTAEERKVIGFVEIV